jgi:hypothetical protein
MNVGDTVYVCSEDNRCKSVISDETGLFWKIKTTKGEDKYSKRTLKKVEYPYFDCCFIASLK